MKSKLEIINETAAHFNFYNLGRNKAGGCCYETQEENPDERKRCAVGRCMTSDALVEYGNFEDFIGSLANRVHSDHSEKTYQDILQEEYQGHDLEFWSQLQRFHDNTSNWNKNGITYTGQSNKAELIKNWT